MAIFEGIPPIYVILSVIPIYILLNALYRITLVPLAKFPGDKLAGMTGLYELFYDCIRPGQYFLRISAMHDRSGPVVRIGPDEVHINDPNFFEQFYASTARVAKPDWYYQFADNPASLFETRGADLHRLRRAALVPFFSRQNVETLDPLVKRKTEKLVDRIRQKKASGQIVDLHSAYRAFAMDVVSETTLPKESTLLDRDDFAALFHRIWRVFVRLSLWDRYIGLVMPVFKALPATVLRIVAPWALFIITTSRGVGQFVKAQAAAGVPPGSNVRGTVLETLLATDISEIKDPGRIAQEACSMVVQGTEPVGQALEVITYQILSHPDVLQKLKAELRALPRTEGGILSAATLEQCPYLAGVISEGLRMATPVSGRLPRINFSTAIQIHGYTIPPGTTVSMTPRLVHSNDAAFASPDVFKPERWLEDADRARLQKYLVPFGRGQRNCIGMFLAYKELYMVIGNLFRQFDMELYKTSAADVRMESDLFFAFSRPGSKGLQVTCK